MKERLKKSLHDKCESIKIEFLDKYVINTRSMDFDQINKVKDTFTLFIQSICEGQIEKSFSTVRSLAQLNIDLGVPYVILVHEFMQLQKVIMGYVLNNDGDKLFELHQFYLKIEDIIAQVYLEEYTEQLLSKNNRRIANLSDIYEKNIVQHYKAHLRWLSKLAKNVQNRDQEVSVQLDPCMCQFGKWLNSDGKNIIQNNSKYFEIDIQHKNLHTIANNIQNYLQKDEQEYHVLLTYLEKCEMISLSLGTELALLDNTLINSQASKDPLTGALNRQKLGQLYINQLEISFATSQSFVLAICDLDYFKSINDTYGHLAGDMVLKSFVDLAKKHLRGSDLIIRYGGEEFVLILPAVKYDVGNKILNRFREAFSLLKVQYDENIISTTVSIGMMEVSAENSFEELECIEDAIEIVDKKLYKAKELGRDMVV